MSDFKEKSHKIIKKCVQLGCLSLPDAEYFEKIERSRNCAIFDNFIQRVHDRQKILRIRNNILIHTSKDDSRPAAKLPVQLQHFIQSKALARQILDAKKVNKEIKRREESHLEDVFQKSNRLRSSENLTNTQSSKVAILRAKGFTLDDGLKREHEAEQKIRSVLPQKLTISHKTADLKEEITKSINLLRQFYKETNSGGDPPVLPAWNQLKEYVQVVPNYFSFQMVIKELESNYTQLCELTASTVMKKTQSQQITEKVLPELNEQVIVNGIQLISRKKKLAQLKSSCSDAIQLATCRLEDALISELDCSYQTEDLVRDFMAATLTKFSLQGKLQQLENLKRSFRQEIYKENFATSVQEAQKINALMEKRFEESQQNIAQLLMINEKLNSGKFSMARMVQELKTHSKQLNMSRGMKFSQAFGPETPSHCKELEGFLNIPLANFAKLCMFSSDQKEISFLNSDETFGVMVKQGLVDVLNLCEFLSTAKTSIGWNEVLKVQASEKTKFHAKVLQQVRINELEKSLQLNRESISEFFDAISKNHSEAKRILQDCQVLYKFSVDNPMKRFIPETKKFEGKTFKMYEMDFNLYYGMIKN